MKRKSSRKLSEGVLRHKTKLFLLLLICFPLVFTPQNLVINPSVEEFEDYEVKPEKRPKYWKIISGTPDFYFVNDSMGIIEDINFKSLQLDSFRTLGSYFFGLRSGTDGTEVLQAEFIRPLEKNKLYSVEIYVAKPKHFCKRIEKVKVTLTKYGLKYTEMPSNYTIGYMDLRMKMDEVLTASEKWVKFSNLYLAKGGEKYLAIGDFEFPIKLDNTIIKGQSFYPVCGNIYYDSLIVNEFDVQNLNKFVLNSIYFETDSSSLPPKYINDINNTLTILSQLKNIKILINGYSDSSGDKSKNLLLS